MAASTQLEIEKILGEIDNAFPNDPNPHDDSGFSSGPNPHGDANPAAKAAGIISYISANADSNVVDESNFTVLDDPDYVEKIPTAYHHYR